MPQQDKLICTNALVNEFVTLVDVVSARMLSRTNTIKLIKNNGVPVGREIMYGKLCEIYENIKQKQIDVV